MSVLRALTNARSGPIDHLALLEATCPIAQRQEHRLCRDQMQVRLARLVHHIAVALLPPRRVIRALVVMRLCMEAELRMILSTVRDFQKRRGRAFQMHRER